MTPSEMDAMYPDMEPNKMSDIVVMIEELLSGEWSTDEITNGRRWQMPLNPTQGSILATYFWDQGWLIEERHNIFNAIIIFRPGP